MGYRSRGDDCNDGVKYFYDRIGQLERYFKPLAGVT
jgi:hypothetical protein